MTKKNAVYKATQKLDICFTAIPQKQLPCLQVDGRLIPQSGAIMRYVAREFGIWFFFYFRTFLKMHPTIQIKNPHKTISRLYFCHFYFFPTLLIFCRKALLDSFFYSWILFEQSIVFLIFYVRSSWV